MDKTIFYFLAACWVQWANSKVQWSQMDLIKRSFSANHGRIIGGDEVEPHSIPFQVGLTINGDSFCGGSLISENYVLTAGHCGELIRSVVVILGAHNMSAPETDTRVEILGDKVIIHADFDNYLLWNDITLIHLQQSAPINDYIQVARLPPKSDVSNSYMDKVAIASGWGFVEDVPYPSTRYLSPVLKAVEVAVSNWTECAWWYNNEEVVTVLDTNVCTSGYRLKGTCNGDSGGPLILDAAVIGITSFGTALCETCAPSVYTRVANYLDWIAVNSDVVVS